MTNAQTTSNLCLAAFIKKNDLIFCQTFSAHTWIKLTQRNCTWIIFPTPPSQRFPWGDRGPDGKINPYSAWLQHFFSSHNSETPNHTILSNFWPPFSKLVLCTVNYPARPSFASPSIMHSPGTPTWGGLGRATGFSSPFQSHNDPQGWLGGPRIFDKNPEWRQGTSDWIPAIQPMDLTETLKILKMGMCSASEGVIFQTSFRGRSTFLGPRFDLTPNLGCKSTIKPENHTKSTRKK